MVDLVKYLPEISNVAAGEDLEDAHTASEGTSSSSEGSDSEQVGQFYHISLLFLLKIN